MTATQGSGPGTDTTLTRDLVVASGAARTKEDAIREAGTLLVRSGAVTPAYVEAMLERERSISTYMGSQLAIPHGTNESKGGILRSAVSLVRYDEPIEWGGGSPVRVVVGIAGIGDEHLQILSKVAIVFSDEDLARAILEAPTADGIYETLQAVNDD